MNTEAMLAVADVIEHFDRFDLGNWGPVEKVWTDCGTTACIAGWTLAWADRSPVNTRPEGFLGSFSAPAADELGLTDDQAKSLFFPGGAVWSKLEDETGVCCLDLTAAQAADVLRRIARGELEL